MILYIIGCVFFNENVCADVVLITDNIVLVVVCGHRLYYNMDTLLSLIIYLFCGAFPLYMISDKTRYDFRQKPG